MAYKKLKFWFDKELAELLAEKICEIQPEFPRHAFVERVDERVQPLELKPRVEVMADELFWALGEDYTSAVSVLLQTLGPENPNETGMFTEFYWVMPFAKLVEKYGLGDWPLSMQAIGEITKRNTSEYAIRPYIEAYPEQTLAQMKAWSQEENFHLRRLASEGGRPRLPWASKLQQFIDDPAPLLPILDTLKDDPIKFVQKSVANCLNDILKDNPQTGKALMERWASEEAGKERKWIMKHALRSLKKANDEWALAFLDEL